MKIRSRVDTHTHTHLYKHTHTHTLNPVALVKPNTHEHEDSWCPGLPDLPVYTEREENRYGGKQRGSFSSIIITITLFGRPL